MTRPCRILYHHRIRAEDGQAVHVRELIGALGRAGHEVLEVALVPKVAVPGGGGGSQRWSPLQSLRLPRAALEVLEVIYNGKGRRMVLAAARSFRPDFLYERHALHCRVGLDAARALDIPLLLEVNAPMSREMARLGLLRLPRRARRTERAVLAGADRVLPVTRVLADILEQDGARPQAVRVVPNGACPERYGAATTAAARAVRSRWALPPDAFAVGFVGYMRPWHRLDLVLEAMARPQLARVHLVLVGAGPALSDLLGRARAGGMGGRVHALGAVPAALLPAHVSAFDAALVPAINGYASPLKLFDSLAAAVPTLAPRQPNLEEIITDGRTGLLFAPEDAAELAAALHGLLIDPERARVLGAAGRQSLLDHRWTWDGNAERVVDCFREVAR